MDEFFRNLFETPQQLESITGTQVLISMTIALICGILIFLVYRFFNQSVVYSVRFNMLIMMVTIITSLIIITIGANLVLTLGMVGALSIVRFRAAVKDPLDVGFLFWGVGAGLTAGAQLYSVALIGTAFIALVYILLTIIRLDKHSYLVIIRYDNQAEEAVNEKIKPLRTRLKNKTVAESFCELTVEVRAGRAKTEFVGELKEVKGVDTVTLVEYTGDYS